MFLAQTDQPKVHIIPKHSSTHGVFGPNTLTESPIIPKHSSTNDVFGPDRPTKSPHNTALPMMFLAQTDQPKVHIMPKHSSTHGVFGPNTLTESPIIPKHSSTNDVFCSHRPTKSPHNTALPMMFLTQTDQPKAPITQLYPCFWPKHTDRKSHNTETQLYQWCFWPRQTNQKSP